MRGTHNTNREDKEPGAGGGENYAIAHSFPLKRTRIRSKCGRDTFFVWVSFASLFNVFCVLTKHPKTCTRNLLNKNFTPFRDAIYEHLDIRYCGIGIDKTLYYRSTGRLGNERWYHSGGDTQDTLRGLTPSEKEEMHQSRRKEASCALKRLDKYYTKQAVVRKCLQTICLDDYDLVIEPSAGAGAFYHAILHRNKIGLDISPDHEEIIKGDWLKHQVDGRYKSVLVIGNPPFGKYHSLSKKFIEHSLRFANVKTIAFVLPNVYKKYTRQMIIPTEWRIKHIIPLPRNAFMVGEKDFHMPSSFFVIDKSSGTDLRTLRLTHINEIKDFSFGTRQDYDLFVFGAAPKRVICNATPNNRGYFLKSKIDREELRQRITQIPWQGNSCANGGVYWLNKTEFLEQYLHHYPENERGGYKS